MQAAFLISVKGYTEKQVGLLFFFFGVSQFLLMAPSGYFLDYSSHKIKWVIWAGVATAALTVVSAVTALPYGENMRLQIIVKLLQGGISAILPVGFNGITLGIVGSTGFTYQVSRNRMMNHFGTAIVIFFGSLIAYSLYPNIGFLFIVAPLAALGTWYNLRRIKPDHVDRDAARGLVVTSPTMTEYEEMDDALWISTDREVDNEPCGAGITCSGSPTYIPPDILPIEDDMQHQREKSSSTTTDSTTSSDKSATNAAPTVDHQQSSLQQPSPYSYPKPRDDSSKILETVDSGAPSFRLFGQPRRAQAPIRALLDPTLCIFSLVVFSFHLSNGSVLPLVMQSLALRDPQSGILLSGLCIFIGQIFMVFFAKICGDYSPRWGRKRLTLLALFSLTIRCYLLTFLVDVEDATGESYLIKVFILSTQFLDSVGAGVFGTMHVLITNDISGGTGRFSLMMGITTGAMCLGGTVSGYIGQALAQDYGYGAAFSALGMMSLMPFFLYLVAMPETLPDYETKARRKRRKLRDILKKIKHEGFRKAFSPETPTAEFASNNPNVELV